MGDSVELKGILEGFSDLCSDWICHRTTPVSVDQSLLNRCFLVKKEEVCLLPMSVSKVPKVVSSFVFYPVYFQEDEICGRSFGMMADYIKQLEELGLQVGNIIEERFAVTMSRNDVFLVTATLLDDGQIFLSRDEFNLSGGQDRLTYFAITTQEDPWNLGMSFKYINRINCKSCSNELKRCICSSLTDSFPSEPTRSLQDEGIWKNLISLATTDYLMEVSPVSGNMFERGPTPSMVYAPRILSHNICESPVNREWMLGDHLRELSQRRRRSMAVVPLLIDEESAANSLAITQRATEREPTRQQGSKLCVKCGRYFHRNYDLWRHTVSAHANEKNFACTLCPKTFALRQNLVTHISDVHERRRSERCPTCDQEFSTAHKMRSHLRRVHLKERSQVCEHCGYSCFQASDLNRHMHRAHTPKGVV